MKGEFFVKVRIKANERTADCLELWQDETMLDAIKREIVNWWGGLNAEEVEVVDAYGWEERPELPPDINVPAWFEPRVQFLSETDSKTVQHFLRTLEGEITIRMKIAGQDYFDVNILDTNAIAPNTQLKSFAAFAGQIERVYGFQVVRLDRQSKPSGEPFFIPYEDIDEIGIY